MYSGATFFGGRSLFFFAIVVKQKNWFRLIIFLFFNFLFSLFVNLLYYICNVCFIKRCKHRNVNALLFKVFNYFNPIMIIIYCTRNNYQMGFLTRALL